jgi:hypothetical protein
MESVEHSWIYVAPTPDKADTETTIMYLSEWRSRASGEWSAIGKLTGESGSCGRNTAFPSISRRKRRGPSNGRESLTSTDGRVAGHFRVPA